MVGVFIDNSVWNVQLSVLFQVTFNYDGKNNIFEKLDISAVMDSRIAVVGENGSGKTTLLKILLGELDPIKGIRHTHRYYVLVSDEIKLSNLDFVHKHFLFSSLFDSFDAFFVYREKMHRLLLRI